MKIAPIPSPRISASRCAVMHTYKDDDVSVTLRIDAQNRINVAMSTARLRLETVNQMALGALSDLYADGNVMKLCGGSRPKPFDYAEKRLKRWIEQANNGDPYHALMVFQQSDDAIIGFAVLGHSEDSGVAELTRFFFKEQWGKGYGTETASAIAKNLAPALCSAGYRMRNAPLSTIRAAVEPKNEAARQSLIKSGFCKAHHDQKFGWEKNIYTFTVNQDISLSSVMRYNDQARVDDS